MRLHLSLLFGFRPAGPALVLDHLVYGIPGKAPRMAKQTGGRQRGWTPHLGQFLWRKLCLSWNLWLSSEVRTQKAREENSEQQEQNMQKPEERQAEGFREATGALYGQRRRWREGRRPERSAVVRQGGPWFRQSCVGWTDISQSSWKGAVSTQHNSAKATSVECIG